MIELQLKQVLRFLRVFDENPDAEVVYRYQVDGETLEFEHEQIKALVDMFAGDHNAMVGVERLGKEAHSGPGLYGYYFACPDEPSLFLDKPRDGQ